MGRTMSRYWDAEKICGAKCHVLVRVVASKYLLESNTRKRWPTCATNNEDFELREPKWNEKYDGDQRIVMWDMTNIGCFGFSDANVQRLTVCFVNCLDG